MANIDGPVNLLESDIGRQSQVAVALCLSGGGYRAMLFHLGSFTGDAEGETENQARLNSDGNVKTTVLSGSHHGARTHGSNSRRWPETTAREVVVFSAGRKFGHPQCDAVGRFESSVADTDRHPTQFGEGSAYQPVRNTRQAIYMTEINGTIIVTSDGTSPLSLFCNDSDGCDVQIAH